MNIEKLNELLKPYGITGEVFGSRHIWCGVGFDVISVRFKREINGQTFNVIQSFDRALPPESMVEFVVKDLTPFLC